MDPVKRSPSCIQFPDAKFEVFTAMKIEVAVLWVVAPCSDVGGYQR